jgi:hypothetical protein
MTKKKYKDQSTLEFIHSGTRDGHVYLIGIRHVLPDPTEDLSSTVFDLTLSTEGLEWKALVQGASLFDYPSWFTCLVVDPRGTLYIGEGNGYIKYQDDKSTVFSLKKIPDLKGNLQCAYVRGVDDVVFGSYHGELVHVQGDKISVHKIGKSKFEHITASLNQIHGIGADFMVVVGDNGNIGRYQNGAWERIRPPSNIKLEAVWCRSQNEIYVGGWEGHAWRWDGNDKWQKLVVPSPEEGKSFYINDFAEYQGVLYAACCDRGIHRLEGDKLVPVPKVKNEYVGRLATTNLGLVGLGGVWGEEGSWFTLFDGKSWRSTQIQLKRA